MGGRIYASHKVKKGVFLGESVINNNPQRLFDGTDTFYLYDGNVFKIHNPLNRYADNGRCRTTMFIRDAKENMNIASILLNNECLNKLESALA